MLSISGVYAEDIDVDSSVVAESPISADVDTSLSSCDAFNNDLSNIYEPSYSSDSYESSNSYESYESSEVPQINNEISCARYNSLSYYESCDISVINVDYMDSYESVDVPVVDVDCLYCDTLNSYEFVDGIITDLDVNYADIDYGTLKIAVIDECDEDGELNPAIGFVEDKVILNNYNSCSKNLLENINIPVLSECLNKYEFIDQKDDTIISEVTSDMETSESYKLIRHVTQEDNLLKFENADAILAIDVSGIPNASEPVFDGILRVSEYISDVGEVYFGTLSQEDSEKLLKSVGSENTLMFASIANWYPDVTFNMLQELANHGQICEEILDGYTVTKALLQFYPQTNELYIYIIGGSEDEHSHVIHDTNSHGLDYAYGKHVDVIYKDMPNLIVLTSYGVVFIKEQQSVGHWDGLNDILGARISSETLLPDHKAIWTPLLLLTQQDLQKSIDSHTGDNKKKNKINAMDKTNNNHTNGTNSSNKTPSGGGNHHYHKYWGYDWWPSSCCCCQFANTDVVSQLDNVTKNSTNNTNSSNITTNGKRKSIETPKTNIEEAEPTYTLVYAIIGIAIVSILFNSSYMKRDD